MSDASSAFGSVTSPFRPLRAFGAIGLRAAPLVLALACSDDATTPPGVTGGSGGDQTAGAGAGSGGGAGDSSTMAGATSGGAGGTGGAGGAGAAGESGGGAGGAPMAEGGMAGMTMAEGGTAGETTEDGGMGGMSMAEGGAAGEGGGDGKLPVDPSAGCGKANPQTGDANSPLNIAGHMYYVKLPPNYDPDTPYPVVMGLNPTGTSNAFPWAERNLGFENNEAAQKAIRVYPQCANLNAGWNDSDFAFFEPFHTAILENFCVDKARVFITGESSGGDFSSIVGCEYGDRLTSVGPCATKAVPQRPLNVSQRQCTGHVSAVVIHGKNDNVVGPANGPLTRDFYGELANCDMSAMPEPVEGYTDTLSNCVEYQGCDEGATLIWCNHTDPNYSGTNHGWPAFAGDFLWEYWSQF